MVNRFRFLLLLALLCAPSVSFGFISGSYFFTLNGTSYGPYADPFTACTESLPLVSVLPYSAGPVKNPVVIGDGQGFTCQADFMQFSGVYWTQNYSTFLPAIGKTFTTSYSTTPPPGTTTGTTTGTTAASGVIDVSAVVAQLAAINTTLQTMSGQTANPTQSFLDGTALGWAVVAVWSIAFGIRLIVRTMRAPKEDHDAA